MAEREGGVRQRNRADVEARLLAAARGELARVGAAALSVRAVARAMGMAPSALFRYIAGRDDLLTLLIVAAYDDLADAVEARERAVPRADPRGRWRAIAHGVRDWAHAHPHEWALLYGSPVPEYDAPAERTTAAGTRVTDLLVALAGEPEWTPPAPVPGDGDGAALAADATAGLTEAPGLAAVVMTHGIVAWTSLIGAVSAEVFQQLGADLAHNDALFAYGVRVGEWLLFGGPAADG